MWSDRIKGDHNYKGLIAQTGAAMRQQMNNSLGFRSDTESQRHSSLIARAYLIFVA